MPSLAAPAWLAKPVTATGSAVKRTTVGTWSAVTTGTTAAFRKTATLLDPFPNDPPGGRPSSNANGERPATPSEFFEQDRP